MELGVGERWCFTCRTPNRFVGTIDTLRFDIDMPWKSDGIDVCRSFTGEQGQWQPSREILVLSTTGVRERS